MGFVIAALVKRIHMASNVDAQGNEILHRPYAGIRSVQNDMWGGAVFHGLPAAEICRLRLCFPLSYSHGKIGGGGL